MKKAKPIETAKEVKDNPDPHIDQDFEGFPDQFGSKKVITPTTTNERKTAAIDTKDGDKIIKKPKGKTK